MSFTLQRACGLGDCLNRRLMRRMCNKEASIFWKDTDDSKRRQKTTVIVSYVPCPRFQSFKHIVWMCVFSCYFLWIRITKRKVVISSYCFQSTIALLCDCRHVDDRSSQYTILFNAINATVLYSTYVSRHQYLYSTIYFCQLVSSQLWDSIR